MRFLYQKLRLPRPKHTAQQSLGKTDDRFITVLQGALKGAIDGVSAIHGMEQLASEGY